MSTAVFAGVGRPAFLLAPGPRTRAVGGGPKNPRPLPGRPSRGSSRAACFARAHPRHRPRIATRLTGERFNPEGRARCTATSTSPPGTLTVSDEGRTMSRNEDQAELLRRPDALTLFARLIADITP